MIDVVFVIVFFSGLAIYVWISWNIFKIFVFLLFPREGERDEENTGFDWPGRDYSGPVVVDGVVCDELSTGKQSIQGLADRRQMG